MRRRAHPRVRRRARVAARGDSRHYARRRRAFRAPRVQRASPRARCRHRRVSRALARARRRASRESTRACEERDVVNDARASGMARVRARARPFARSRGRRTRVGPSFARSRDRAAPIVARRRPCERRNASIRANGRARKNSRVRSTLIAVSLSRNRRDRHHATRANSTRDATISTTRSGRVVAAFCGTSLRSRARSAAASTRVTRRRWARRRSIASCARGSRDRDDDARATRRAQGSVTRGAWTRLLWMVDLRAHGRRAGVARHPRNEISRFRGLQWKTLKKRPGKTAMACFSRTVATTRPSPRLTPISARTGRGASRIESDCRKAEFFDRVGRDEEP